MYCTSTTSMRKKAPSRVLLWHNCTQMRKRMPIFIKAYVCVKATKKMAHEAPEWKKKKKAQPLSLTSATSTRTHECTLTSPPTPRVLVDEKKLVPMGPTSTRHSTGCCFSLGLHDWIKQRRRELQRSLLEAPRSSTKGQNLPETGPPPSCVTLVGAFFEPSGLFCPSSSGMEL